MTNKLIDPISIEKLSRILGEYTTGGQLTQLLIQCSLECPEDISTKWRRINFAFLRSQEIHQTPNHILRFVKVFTEPVRFIDQPHVFNELMSEINPILAFSGYKIDNDNNILRTSIVTNISDAQKRSNELKQILSQRQIHPEVIKFCKPELLDKNYFHAVLEANKSVFEKIRQLSSLTCDGSELIDKAFSTKNPILALNTLRTDSERSEQSGFANLLKGISSMFRNPTAHSPKVYWEISKEDAVDLMSTLSFVHRKLESNVVKVPNYKH
jgi:uncharacterized protein (TIGR02391 family)